MCSSFRQRNDQSVARRTTRTGAILHLPKSLTSLMRSIPKSELSTHTDTRKYVQ